jgi:hypothetical protein
MQMKEWTARARQSRRAFNLCRNDRDKIVAGAKSPRPTHQSGFKRQGAATRTRAITGAGNLGVGIQGGKRTVNDFRCKF